jgi:hypothetical protein
MKLFEVKKVLYPEWGKSSELWNKYFVCKDYEAVKNKLEEMYGGFVKWFDYDRCEERIEIIELNEVEFLE